jgi:hypothetical protein
MSDTRDTVFKLEIQLECDCVNHMCGHLEAALGTASKEAWRAGRKAGIAAVIQRLKEAAESGLVLRLQDGRLELPKSFDDLGEPFN